MTAAFFISELKKRLEDKESFKKEDLYNFFIESEPDLNYATFRWRLFDLKHKKLIVPISRNHYSFNYKSVFEPTIARPEYKIDSFLKKEFQDFKSAVWSTSIINEFMLHLPVRYYIIVEVEKDALEPVFNFLKTGHFGYSIFLDPGDKELEKYVSELDTAIIVQPLISKAPLQKIGKTSTTTLEKLLVDLFCEPKLFASYQGAELAYIFNNAYDKYSVNMTKLFNYANRRARRSELMEFLRGKTNVPINVSND